MLLIIEHVPWVIIAVLWLAVASPLRSIRDVGTYGATGQPGAHEHGRRARPPGGRLLCCTTATQYTACRLQRWGRQACLANLL